MTAPNVCPDCGHLLTRHVDIQGNIIPHEHDLSEVRRRAQAPLVEALREIANAVTT